jgi:hypothetical protein
MKRHLEERLRSDADSFRRPPSRALGERVRSELVAGAAGTIRPTFDDETPSLPWRDRLKATTVALAVLAAAGFWVVALLGVFGDGATLGGKQDLAGGAGAPAVDRPDSPSLLVELGRAIPVQNPLAAELDRIGQDATRAARFLVGRLPAPLASNAPEDR